VADVSRQRDNLMDRHAHAVFWDFSTLEYVRTTLPQNVGDHPVTRRHMPQKPRPQDGNVMVARSFSFVFYHKRKSTKINKETFVAVLLVYF
jgi:hypothetical protein